MSFELVTVAKFATSLDAHLAKMHLDANGIDAVVVGESFAHVYTGSQMGFIELQVAADKVDGAAKILESQQQE